MQITGRIARETSLRPMGHLTCVGHTREELEQIVESYRAAGVRNILALRGDPREGPSAPWTPTPGGLTYASELVELVRGLGGFSIGVAAFPEGHPAAESRDADARVLAAKAEAGAEFAVTQLFFRADDYFAPGRAGARRRRPTSRSCPGIMPITNLSSVRRMAELSGARGAGLGRWRASTGSPSPPTYDVKACASRPSCARSCSPAARPGLHFYTLNRSRATLEIFEALKITA